jgi:WD40 repeat protein
VTSSDDRTARVWDGLSGEAMSEAAHASAPVDDARFIADRSKVTLLLEHGRVQTYILTAGTRLLPASAGEVPSIRSAANDPSDLNSLKERLRPKHSGEITKMALSPRGNILATSSTDKFARLWDARTLELRAELSHDVTVNCVAFSPDGARVATSTSIPTRVRVWDVQTAQPLSEWIFVDKPVAAVAFSADGLFVISSSGWKWKLHPISGKAPEWLPTLAEAVAGVRYTSGGILETVAPEAFESARKLISNASGTDGLKEWARELIGNDEAK